MAALTVDEGSLPCQPPLVSTDMAGASNNPVARDEDRRLIAAARTRDGASGGWLADTGGNRSIGLHLTVWDRL